MPTEPSWLQHRGFDCIKLWVVGVRQRKKSLREQIFIADLLKTDAITTKTAEKAN